MPKPTPGKNYTIVDEDTLSQVARRAYGNGSQWPRIWRANESALRSGDPDLIFPGEIIFIPELAELLREDPGINNREPDELSIVINGIEIRHTAARVMLTMDTLADGWTATLPWTRGDNPALDAALLPYSYAIAKVYIGGVLKISGYLYTPEYSQGSDGTTVGLAGFSKTADMIDSDMTPPYEENNVDLKQRVTKLAQAHGLKAVFTGDYGGPFDRVTAGESEKIGAHLGKLAAERGILQSSTPDGNLLYQEADVDSAPVATLEEGKYPVGKLTSRGDGRRRWNSYRVTSTTPFGANEPVVVKDDSVPRSRVRNIRVTDSIAGEMSTAAKWARNRAVADSLTMSVPVIGWINDRTGLPWDVNTKVTLVAPSIRVPKFDFINRSIEFEEKADSKSAILNIVPPQVYTKKEIVEPWG